MKFTTIFLFLSFIAHASVASAQSNIEPSSNLPIEISAEDSLEWLQNENQYIANGSVIVTQGEMSLSSDKLIANYNDTDGDATNITNLVATGNVTLKDNENTVKGDKITYDFKSKDVIVTGSNLSIVTPEQTITASEKLTYNSKEGIAKAIGDAKIKTPNETLKAKTIMAKLSSNSKLLSANAIGGVTIATKEETITGTQGFYNVEAQKATIEGNVKIVRGKNTLEGDKATVNLKTNVSQILGNQKNGERVKGVFFPSTR